MRSCLTFALFCAFLVPSAAAQDPASDVALRGVVIPTGFDGRMYSAMIQVAVNGSPLPGATWDLNASFTATGQAAEDFSGRVEGGEPGAPVVFEAQLEFLPGPYALTLKAHETTAGQSGTRMLEGRWPDPETQRAMVSPVVLLQPVAGAFVRGENARSQGALALGKDVPAKTQLPTAVVSVVCRGPMVREPVRVERALSGASSVDFQPIELPPGQDPCAQVRDIIPPGTMTAGFFKYDVQLMTSTERIASGGLEFTAVAGN